MAWRSESPLGCEGFGFGSWVEDFAWGFGLGFGVQVKGPRMFFLCCAGLDGDCRGNGGRYGICCSFQGLHQLHIGLVGGVEHLGSGFAEP